MNYEDYAEYSAEYEANIEDEYENALKKVEDKEEIELENNNEDIQLSGFAKFSQEYLEIQQKLNEIQLQLIVASNEQTKLATEIVPMEELIKQNSNEQSELYSELTNNANKIRAIHPDLKRK